MERFYGSDFNNLRLLKIQSTLCTWEESVNICKRFECTQ